MKRRDFLKSATVFSVAVSLGPACATTRQGRREDGAFEPSAWIRVYPDDRVVFALARAEIGQGVYTSHAMMVAEELGIEPASVEVELAMADPRFAGAGGRGQTVGASISTRQDFEPLRERAAAARAALVGAAAQRLSVSPADIVQDGRVFHVAGDLARRVNMGQLVDDAAAHLPNKGRPKPRSEWRWLGKSQPRLDAADKSFGRTLFGIDVHVEGLRYASVWRALTEGQRTLVAQKLREGTTRDLEVVEIEGAVALVGDNTWAPMQALKSAQGSKWGQEVVRSVGPDSAEITRVLDEALAGDGAARARNDGDFDDDDAEIALDLRFSFPYLAHQTMEPMNATAHVHKRDGDITGAEIWVPSQSIGTAQAAAANVLGIEREDVVARQTFAGGGFGRRGGFDFVVEPVMLSAKLNAPVRVTWSREEDTQYDRYRAGTSHRLQVKVRAGTLTGWSHRVAGPSLLGEALPRQLEPERPLFAGVARFVTRTLFDNHLVAAPIPVECAAELPYAIENLRVEHVQVNPGPPTTFWRANGASFNSFVFETAIDDVARLLGKDPIAYRLELLGDHPRHRAVLEAVKELSGWGRRALSPGRALGVAVVSSYDSYVAQVAEVSAGDGAIRVHRVWVAVDCGIAINPDGVKQQMESGVIYGLSAALHQHLDFVGGRPVQGNFHDLPLLRMNEAPDIETIVLPSDEPPTGVGEPGVPPIAPAVANGLRELGLGPFDRLPLRLTAGVR